MGPETSVFRSCSASINGEFYVFGGEDDNRRQVLLSCAYAVYQVLFQISKINGCSLDRIGQLPHEFVYGSCGTYKFPEERVMFCFQRSMESACFR